MSGWRAGSPVPSRVLGSGSMCRGWWRAWNARTGGRWLSRSAPTGPGTPTSPCPWPPWPGWPPAKPWPQRGNRPRRPRHDRLHATRTPPPVDQAGPTRRPHRRPHLALVPMATPTPAPGPTQPLPSTTPPNQISAVAVLGGRRRDDLAADAPMAPGHLLDDDPDAVRGLARGAAGLHERIGDALRELGLLARGAPGGHLHCDHRHAPTL